MNYEYLLDEAAASDVYVIENAPFESNSKGLINNDVIGLNKNISTSSERACVLAEELGHYYTTSGNILNVSDIANAKQERTARIWAYNKMIGLQGIINAYKHRCVTKEEIIEYLGVTAEFFDEAVHTYAEKYGVCTQVDNYVVFFTPSLGVMELIA